MAFEFDTTEAGGSKGPWVGWKSAGSAKHGIPPKSFCIRGKDDFGNSTTEVFGAFARGVCIDGDSIKQGFMKDNGKGVAPERRFDVRVRPDDSKKQTPTGSRYCWSNAFTCRIAFTGADGQQTTATWEDSAFGAYEGFRHLMVLVQDDMKAQGAALSGKSPVVVLTGVEEKSFAGGDSVTPIFAIKTWVPTPPIFAAESGAAAFSTAPASPPASPAARLTPAPQPARPAPAPQPAPAFADDDVPF